MAGFVEWGLELIRRTSSDLSPDVEARLREWHAREEAGSTAKNVLEMILQNVEMARAGGTPICQDTGLSSFYVHVPRGVDGTAIQNDLTEAIRQAVKLGMLRPNAVHPVTGKNSGDNVGVNQPYFSVEVHDGPEITVDLILKGGGSENVGAQYRLPEPSLKAGRDLKGVEKVILDGVFKAQGFGCSPGILGICIGGDRAGSYAHAKKQLLRRLDDVNPDPALAELEQRLYEKLNELGVGPMGFGGTTTVLGVKVGWLHRHPASYFVSMAYCCWADRRHRLVVRDGQAEFV